MLEATHQTTVICKKKTTCCQGSFTSKCAFCSFKFRPQKQQKMLHTERQLQNSLCVFVCRQINVSSWAKELKVIPFTTSVFDV